MIKNKRILINILIIITLLLELLGAYLILRAPDGSNYSSFEAKYCGYKDILGFEVIKPVYDEVEEFEDGRAQAKKNGKWGLINPHGKVIADFIYDEMFSFSEGLAAVKKDNKWGFIDRNGKICIPIKYEEANDFVGGVANVKNVDSNGFSHDFFVDRSGKEILKSECENASIELADDYGKHQFYLIKINKGDGITDDYQVDNGKLTEINYWGPAEESEEYEERLWAMEDAKEMHQKTVLFAIFSLLGMALTSFVFLIIRLKLFSIFRLTLKQGLLLALAVIVMVLAFLGWRFLSSPEIQHYCQDSTIVFKSRLTGKIGFMNKRKQVIISPQFDVVNNFKEGLAGVKLHGKWGFIDQNGTLKVKTRYDEVSYCFIENRALVRLGRKWGAVDQDGVEIIKPHYDILERFENGFALGRNIGGKLLLFDRDGKVIDNYQFKNYSRAYLFKLGGLVLKDKKGLVYCKAGKVVCDTRNDFRKLFTEDQKHGEYVYFGVEDRIGVINAHGKVIIPAEYDEITTSLFNDYFQVVLGESSAVLDRKGELIFPAQSKEIIDKVMTDFKEGRIVVKKNGKWCFGKPTQADDKTEQPSKNSNLVYQNGLIRFVTKGKWGLLDKQNRVCLKPIYDYLKIYDDGYIMVASERQYGLLDRDKNVMIEPSLGFNQLTDLESGGLVVKSGVNWLTGVQGKKWVKSPTIERLVSSKDMVRFIEKGKYGFVNRAGKVVIKPEYDFAGLCLKNRIAVRRGVKMYLIDRQNQRISTRDYDSLTLCRDGCALFQENSKLGMVDSKENIIIKPQYDDIYPFHDGLAVVQFKGKWGYVNQQGKVVVALIYDDVTEFHQGYAGVNVEPKWGVIDTDGKMVVTTKLYGLYWDETANRYVVYNSFGDHATLDKDIRHQDLDDYSF